MFTILHIRFAQASLLPRVRSVGKSGVFVRFDLCVLLFPPALALRLLPLRMATAPSSFAELCAVCDNRTTKKCGACKEIRLCSPECQRLVRRSLPLHAVKTNASLTQVWSTHKWLCRNKGKTFSHAPLTDVELWWLLTIFLDGGQDGAMSRPWNWPEQLAHDGLMKGEETLPVSRAARSPLPLAHGVPYAGLSR